MGEPGRDDRAAAVHATPASPATTRPRSTDQLGESPNAALHCWPRSADAMTAAPRRPRSRSSPAPRAASAAPPRSRFARPAPMSSPGPHPGRARGARRRDPRGGGTRHAGAARPRRRARRSTGWAPRSTSAGAGSTSWSPMPACSARSRRSAMSTPKAWDEVMAVNVTANWRLIRSLDPLLRASDAGRAIFVTSGVAPEVPGLLGPLRRLQGGASTRWRAPRPPRPRRPRSR